MVTPHKKRKDLDAKQHVLDKWAGGKKDRDAMADLLKAVNFNKDCTVWTCCLVAHHDASLLLKAGRL